MFLQWIFLTLLSATAFVLSSTASSDGVSLNCNKTVEVKAEEMVTLKCTIHLNMKNNCSGDQYVWNDTHTQERISCDSGSDYICEWDGQTYVSLTITKVMKEEIYTVHISTDCGMAESSITVVLAKQQAPKSDQAPESDQATKYEQATTPQTLAVLGIFFTLIVLGIFICLFGSERGRKLIKCTMKEKTQGEHSNTDTAHGSAYSQI